ncbi:CPBP family glutamic-type intramembrane protease [Flammeovirga pacifica]|uniref:CAAX prenyl protease 2/Lysostaphin resistance protein A-like domain-containing protein n=1 Tax=Flammeovirga pacifica TaxID=915059 RepID=A0A1S1Z3E4_FLAPC|nr:hypothetical protein NH26_15595 [Flammeovirga pacifica]
MYGEYSYATILLLGTVWAPLKEEFTFRYFLDKKKYTAVISFSLFVATVLLIITKMIFSIGTLSYLLFCIYAIIISPAVYYFVLTKRYVWNENNILYSSVLFGLVHLSNFNQDQFTLIEYYPYLIFYIISISFMGYIFAIIRIRFGMKYNLLIHSLFNLLVFI